MAWIRALNGNVLDVPAELVDHLVSQGHEAFDSEEEARGVKQPNAAKPASPKPNPA